MKKASLSHSGKMEVMRIADQMKRAHRGSAWHGPSLFGVLHGVDAKAASTRVLPGGHTIREIVLHIASWEKAILRTLNGKPLRLNPYEDWPSSANVGREGWPGIISDVKSTYRDLHAAVLRLKDSDLETIVRGRKYTLYVLLHGVIQHTLFHAGQVSIMKKTIVKRKAAHQQP